MTTNALKTFADLSSLSYDPKHVRAFKALVHQTDEVQVNVYVLEPGGRIPMHRHSASWDISFVIEGEIEARIHEGDDVRTVRCGPQSMTVIPPGTLHEVANAGATGQAKFLLIQSPSRNFDFIKETG
jgi:quercetin dioxygenase-like cupin family protein